MMQQLQKVSGMNKNTSEVKEEPAFKVKIEPDVAYAASDEVQSLDLTDDAYYISNFRSSCGYLKQH